MTKEKNLVKNTAIISFGKICTQLVSFFLLPLYTAVLSTTEYGTVDLVITYSALIVPFITLAIEQALFRFLIDVRESYLKTAQIVSTSIFFGFLQSIITLCIICIISFFYSSDLMWYFSLILISSVWSGIAQQLSRGLGDNIGYTLGSTLSAISIVILNVFFLTVLHMTANGMMLASFLGNVVCTLVIAVRINIMQYIKIKYWDKRTLKEMTKYSLPLIPNQLSWWALNASDKVIVQFFIGVAGNGLIAISNKFSAVYIQFSNIFNISWTESAALHINDEDADIFFAKTIVSVYKLFLSACCGIIVVMPFVFPWLINAQYNEAYGLIPIFMLASLFNVIVSLYGVIYVAHKKTVEIAKTAVYAALLNITTHLILIRFIGIYAAAVSTAIGYGGMAIYRYFHSRRYMVIKFSVQTIINSIIMLVISFGAYYSNNLIIQFGAFIGILIISIIINRRIIISMMDYFYKYIIKK